MTSPLSAILFLIIIAVLLSKSPLWPKRKEGAKPVAQA